MSEIQGGRQRPQSAPVRYDQQQPAYQRNPADKEAWKKLENNNKVIQGKLDSVKREPPANFHAPKGYASLKHGNQLQAARSGRPASALPATRDHVDVPPWPPTSVECSRINRSRQQRQIDEENRIMQKKLREVYSSSRLARTLHGAIPAMGPTVNCNELWEGRTSVYSPLSPASASRPATAGGSRGRSSSAARQRPAASQQQEEELLRAMFGGGKPDPAASAAAAAAAAAAASSNSVWTSSGRRQPLSAGSSSIIKGGDGASSIDRRAPSAGPWRVPKTLGLAVCAGCHAKSFRGADGVYLEPCPHCQQVWYCSEVCARIDWVNHKAICKWKQTGHWGAYGSRPTDEHWTANGAVAVARKALRQRQQQQQRRAQQGSAGASGEASPQQQGQLAYEEHVERQLDEAQQIMEVMQRARQQELEDERRQAAIEKAAYDGMRDCERPCMYMGGRPL